MTTQKPASREYHSATEAVQAIDAEAWDAAWLEAGRPYAGTEEAADAANARANDFAYLCETPDGRLVTIPGNDRPDEAPAFLDEPAEPSAAFVAAHTEATDAARQISELLAAALKTEPGRRNPAALRGNMQAVGGRLSETLGFIRRRLA